MKKSLFILMLTMLASFALHADVTIGSGTSTGNANPIEPFSEISDTKLLGEDL